MSRCQPKLWDTHAAEQPIFDTRFRFPAPVAPKVGHPLCVMDRAGVLQPAPMVRWQSTQNMVNYSRCIHSRALLSGPIQRMEARLLQLPRAPELSGLSGGRVRRLTADLRGDREV